MNYTIEIPDIDGNIINAKVGDIILAYCITCKKIRKSKIEGIKKGFKVDLKYTPKASSCIWLGNESFKEDTIFQNALLESQS